MPIKDFIVGDPESVNATELNRYLLQQQHVIKPSTESVTSSTTQQNDDHLFLSVTANTTYWVQAMIIYDGATGGDIKFRWTAPSGATMSWVDDGLDSAAATATDDVSRARQSISSEPVRAAVGAGSSVVAIPKGVLVVGSTSGTFRLQWAQGASSSTATRVLASSILMMRRMVS